MADAPFGQQLPCQLPSLPHLTPSAPRPEHTFSYQVHVFHVKRGGLFHTLDSNVGKQVFSICILNGRP